MKFSDESPRSKPDFGGAEQTSKQDFKKLTLCDVSVSIDEPNFSPRAAIKLINVILYRRESIV